MPSTDQITQIIEESKVIAQKMREQQFADDPMAIALIKAVNTAQQSMQSVAQWIDQLPERLTTVAGASDAPSAPEEPTPIMAKKVEKPASGSSS